MEPRTARGDDEWMRQALEQARLAFQQEEVPVGCVIVYENKCIAAAHNLREQLQDPTAHAEMLAIPQAAKTLESWRLLDCTLYVTLEPCPMCAGAILQSRIPRVVYGTPDPKAGACDSLYQLLTDERLNHRVEVTADILREECKTILQEFFQLQRSRGKK